MQTDIEIPKTRSSRKTALIEAWCTGCGGAPVCMVYCKRDALQLVKDKESPPFMIMTVDHTRCIGCGACVSGGRQGIVLSGCPWNAIRLIRRSQSGESVRQEAT